VDWLYHLAQPFVWHPARAFGIAGGWLLLAAALPKFLRVPLLTGAIGWGIFALLEFEAWRERADIRVDLLFTWPLLCLLSAGCVAVIALRVAKRLSRAGGEAA